MTNDILSMLFVERPLVVNPQLANEIGLNEAIILQQIKYWCDRSEFHKDGRNWFFKTADDWKLEFPFWGKPTIRRIIDSLIEKELIETEKLHGHFFNQHAIQTLWYAIKKIDKACAQSDHIDLSKSENRFAQSDHFQVINMITSTCDQSDHLSTETTTEITTENTKLGASANSEKWNLFELPTNRKGKSFAVTKSLVEKICREFPRLSIHSELSRMRQWLDVNPTKRKPSSSMEQFIFDWMVRAKPTTGKQDMPQNRAYEYLDDGFDFENLRPSEDRLVLSAAEIATWKGGQIPIRIATGSFTGDEIDYLTRMYGLPTNAA